MTEPLSTQITRQQEEQIHREREGRTVAQLSLPRQPIGFEEWMDVIQAAFPDLAFALEAELSAVATLLIHDIGSCISVLLVDAASSGKTLTLDILTGVQEVVYPTDHFTAASFISNSANTKKADLKDIDLLPKIRNKAVVCPDMAPLFATREEDLIRTMGVLTRVLDGEGYQTDTGAHGRRNYSGDYRFVLLGASTPIEQRVWRVMSRLGPRILCLRLHSREKSEEELVGQLRDESYRAKIRRCRDATSEYLRTIWNKYETGVIWRQEADPEECLRIISRCAKLLCRLRGQVTDDVSEWETAREQQRRTVHVRVLSMERPDRINQALFDLARGHAVISGRTALSIDDIPLVLRLTFDSAPENRWPIIRGLIRAGGELGTGDVQTILGRSNPMALRAMATLCTLGICEYVGRQGQAEEARIRFRQEYMWFAGAECRQLLIQSGLLPKAAPVRSKQS